MSTRFQLSKFTGLAPMLVSYLKGMPDEILNNKNYSLRHPGAIYNLVTDDLFNSIYEIDLKVSIDKEKYGNLLKSFTFLVHDFFKFYESCYEILLCFCKSSTPLLKGDFIYRWMKRNNCNLGHTFHEKTKQQVKQLRDTYNSIKHSSNRLQGIVFRNKSNFTIGYWLETTDENGVPSISGQAISLNQQLREIYFFIYFISEALRETIEEFIYKQHGLSIEPYQLQVDEKKYKKLYSYMASLDDFFLLNEINKENYTYDIVDHSIIFSKHNIDETIFEKHYSHGINIELKLALDGYNSSVVIPTSGLTQIGKSFYYQNEENKLKLIPIIP